MARQQLLMYKKTGDRGRAAVKLSGNGTGFPEIPAHITGKFCEHLGSNIYNGMHAEILRNPTFADFPFGGGGEHPDGGVKFLCDEAAIAEQIRRSAERLCWPDPRKLVEAREDSLAHFWIKEGPRDAVRVSPDAAPSGGRAQRVETSAPGQGVAQWAFLPLHRVRSYRWRIVVRSPGLKSLNVSLRLAGRKKPAAIATAKGLAGKWKSLSGTLDLDASLPPDALYRFVVSAPAGGQFVIARALLYPADHVKGADPDVIRFLKASRLPLLRWPGGNFVSGYHWRDGVGPVDARPTLPNPAWGGVEPNLFGTDEFIDFCRAAGCEPMICVNAGNGAPGEAAQWVEYCNGSAGTPMGRLRAANGHPRPFNVKYWEIGNELTGRHQVGWTTPAGYADRYREFAKAMLAADPSIQLIACGAPPLFWREDWNTRLIREDARILRSITDHILMGGRIAPSADPLHVHRDFMTLPALYEKPYRALWKQMEKAGIREPRLAITELQLFGRVGAPRKGEKIRLAQEKLVNPATLAEALYATLVYHLSIRLSPFVEMVTHSATVNHGGGLRKERERVYANPCHYAQAMFADFAGARPLPMRLECAEETAPGVLGCIPKGHKVPLISPLAAKTSDGSILVSIVHCGSEPTVRLVLDVSAAAQCSGAEITTLSAAVPWAANTLAATEAVVPRRETVPAVSGRLEITVHPFSVVQVRLIPGRR
ncbi:MAG TPA: hypothetical protein ENN09_02640 [Planctomycetes bacterium]|nr:hypothetical protein [Planctomycetota bacterium]